MTDWSDDYSDQRPAMDERRQGVAGRDTQQQSMRRLGPTTATQRGLRVANKVNIDFRIAVLWFSRCKQCQRAHSERNKTKGRHRDVSSFWWTDDRWPPTSTSLGLHPSEAAFRCVYVCLNVFIVACIGVIIEVYDAIRW